MLYIFLKVFKKLLFYFYKLIDILFLAIECEFKYLIHTFF